MATQTFKYRDPRGTTYEYGDDDPSTKPWWYDPQKTPVQNAAAQRRAMAGSSATMSQAQRQPSWGQSNYLGSTSRMAPAPFSAPAPQRGLQLPIVGPSNVPAAPTAQIPQGWQTNYSAPRGWQENYSAPQEEVPLSWTDNPGMAPGTTPPYEVRAMQQVAGMPGSGWNSPGVNPDNQAGNPTSYGGNFTPANNLSDGQAIRGGNWSNPAGSAPAAPAIPKGYEKFGQQWWNEFSNTERQLTPDSRGMTTPDQYYQNPAQAQADIAWGAKFFATYGRAPTEDDWRFRWQNGGGAKDNTAMQNAAMAPSGGPYGR